jgi:predicted hotdog family 3-hydroxylacyl-ACP dehydratase
MTIDLTAIPVQDLLPHGDPMVLLAQIEAFGDHSLEASLTVTRDSLFAEDEGVPTWVGLEYMGQAIAAFAGLSARRDNQPVRIGFLVSTRRYEPRQAWFPPGSHLTVAVQATTFNTTGLRVFEGTISSAGTTIVTANLNVYMPEDTAAFMEEHRR